MSLRRYPYYLILIGGMIISRLHAQPFTEEGMMSGTGLAAVPTCAVVPQSQFRVNYGRIDYLRQGLRGMHVYQASAGFSSHLEGFIKFSAEEFNHISSVTSTGFGGKFVLPFSMPVISRMAVWGEMVHSEEPIWRVFPPTINRFALIAEIGDYEHKAIAVLGVSGEGTLNQFLAAAAYSAGISHSLRIGAEVLRGYTGRASTQAMVTGTYRVFDFMTVHVSPGYLTSPRLSTWMLSAGISFSTAEIDFAPVVRQVVDDFQLPSLEELEREMQEEKP